MPDRSAQNAYSLQAVEVMTAWLDDRERVSELLKDRVVDLTLNAPGDATANAIALSIGLVNICGVLLGRREIEAGVSREETLRELGMAFAGR